MAVDAALPRLLPAAASCRQADVAMAAHDPPTPSTNPPAVDVKELRIALVLTGGVSLAIYMHGITLELHKLARASHALEAYLANGGKVPAQVNSATLEAIRGSAYPGKWDTEDIYLDFLLRLSAQHHRRLKVVIDIIGGSSAGGINGLLLGSALAGNRSQDAARTLWIREGGIGRLVQEPGSDELDSAGSKPSRLQRLTGVIDVIWSGWQGRASSDGTFTNITSILKSAAKIFADPTKAVLSGTGFSVKLYDAFKKLEIQDSSASYAASLVPTGETLELLATCTTVRGVRGPILSGGASEITGVSYRQVMRFVHESQKASSFLAGQYTSALAFAARVTSSFPGAFPPTSVKDYSLKVKAPVDFHDPSPASPHFLYGARSPTSNDDPRTAVDIAREQWYMDGGVCDNYPFDIVLGAISDKRASVQTSRELIYVEPDPRSQVEPHEHGEQPTIVETVKQALSTIPGQVSLVDSLARLEESNGIATDVGAIAEKLMNDLIREAEEGANAPVVLAPEINLLSGEIYDAMQLVAEGKRFATILVSRLRISPRSSSGRAIVGMFAKQASLILLSGVQVPKLAYQSRRCEFALQGLNTALATHLTAENRVYLLRIKQVVWDWKVALGAAGLDAADVSLDTHFPSFNRQDPFKSLDPETSLKAISSKLWTSYSQALATRLPALAVPVELESIDDDALCKKLRSRLEKFTNWDHVIFPLLALSRLPALKPVHVCRFSPLDAHLLFDKEERAVAEQRAGVVKSEEEKVRGKAVYHFGAFFSESARENDYLVGRLDAVEMILKMLGRQGTTGTGGESPVTSEELTKETSDLAFDAFRCILRAESAGKDRLSDELIAFVNSKIQAKRPQPKL